MTSQRSPQHTRRLRAGIAGLGLALGLALSGCSASGPDDAATPTPSATATAAPDADATSPAPEATGDQAAAQAAITSEVREFACTLKDKETLEESDLQKFRDIGTDAVETGISGAEAYSQQLSASADQLASLVGQPMPAELKTAMTSTCEQLQ